MRLFYAIWFFFCAGWGYLLAQPFPEAFVTPASRAPAVFVAGLVAFFALLAFGAWRRPADGKPRRPAMDLRPWDLPSGLMVFVFATFVFSACWAVGLALLLPRGSIDMPAFVLALSAGGSAGIWLAGHVFPRHFRD